ncbi:TIM barrel protein [Virgibacillus dakarensis]|uniref:Hexulose-6-phosphate isomerase n=1 Tax=Lentibacillus populi TaxID=1827502 RepID=A0A9W5X4R5_9BACI|nr:sugar phosphate isomerase/epimerase family protein [Lentibacillus populi]MBT2218615.1 sugar phosphate isomerase/epimerase [Virgibacillus dakarensis]MTW87466.1 TIM barrel protein [Virgibacillus dakarensis]GGB37457.1 hexulose-6-phosphate isomerase [Lentibacillus populi]
MRKGLSDASFIPNWGTERFLKAAKKAGFEGVELNLREMEGELTTETSAAEARRLVQLAEHCEIEIATLSTALLNTYPLSSGDTRIREKGLDIGGQLIDFAAEMGAKIVQIVPGAAFAETPYQVSYELAVESLFQLGERAASSGVIIGIENVCNKFLPSPLEFVRFLDDVNHPCVKAYFDNGNALATGYPEHFVNLLKDRIVAVHVKDYWQAAGDFVSILEGNTNWPAVMCALDEIPFKGYLIATPHYPYAYCHDRHIEKYSQDLTSVLNLIKSNKKVNKTY